MAENIYLRGNSALQVYGNSALEENSAHNDKGKGKINDQTGYVHQGSHKGGGGGSWVGAELFKHYGEHTAGDGPPQDHPYQGHADGERYERTMFSIGMEDIVP